MGLAALFSTWPAIPPQHAIYDLCWTLFLPGSLALLLLSSGGNHPGSEVGRLTSSRKVIWDVSVPFLMASIGSVMGCVLSFFVCRTFPKLWLDPQDALLAACCLCASFIGGTVNFFATARVLAGDGEISTLMSSMAAADTFVMAMYFATMALALRSKYLAKLFESPNEGETAGSIHGEEAAISAPTKPSAEKDILLEVGQKTTATTLVTALAWTIVAVSSKIEQLMTPILPGLACAVIAATAPIAQRMLSKRNTVLTTEMQRSARSLAEVLLLMFFASIGAGANLGQVLRNGPACICFSLLALSVHVGLAFTLSVLAKRSFQQSIQLEDVLVASNAAIGGPSTAAAFAGRVKGPRQLGLTMAGTTWGVVGYAIGTTIGVSLYGRLKLCLPPA